MTYRTFVFAASSASFVLLAACVEIKDKDSASKDSASSPAVATAADSSDISFPSYDAYSLDTAGVGQRYASTPADDSAYNRISESSVGARSTKFPLTVPKRGPTALQVQVLLDRAHFSPGIIDGIWGDNAAKALAFFRSPNGSDSTGSTADSSGALDQATYTRLRSVGGSQPIVTRYTVTAEDTRGPFTEIPDNVYQQAKLECLCYSSAAEEVAEKFHTSQKLLAQLNPKANLANLTAGTTLVVPNVEPANVSSPESPSAWMATDSAASGSVVTAGDRAAGPIARLIISKRGFWTHVVDASGRILYHYPSTLGTGYLSSADESPSGGFKITNIAWNPAFHYQPTLFADVSDKKAEARLPKGPNSPVGVVWMALSKPHFGIHGTSAPETIGYTNSHGCVRLTNWDAVELGHLVSSGTPVVFQ